MAATDDTDMPGAGSFPADDAAPDVRALLDGLAHEIAGAGVRHTETLQDMQERIVALTDRAGAAKPDLPHEYNDALARIEGAMSTLAERLADSEPQRYRAAEPADEASDALPETVRAEVRRAIMDASLDAGSTPPVLRSALIDFSGPEIVGTPPLPTPTQYAAGESGEETMAAAPEQRAPKSEPAIEPSWLEARFADIADRVEQSLAAHNPHNALLAIGARFDQLEQRFDSALDQISARHNAGPEALKAVEQHITDLFAQLDRAQSQLGRLDIIESRLTDLRQSLSDEQMTRLIGALSPTDEKLSAIAMAAAERVAASMRSERAEAEAAVGPASDPRLGELTSLLEMFIGEQRQGDAQTAEALDTMQQAMQHIIDRVEAIEAAQISGHEALMRAADGASQDREPVVFAVRTPDPMQATPAAAISHPMADTPPKPAAPIDTPDMLPAAPQPEALRGERHIRSSDMPEPASSGEMNRQALIAMARRAAEKVSNEAPAAGRKSAETSSTRRPSILLVASFAAFLVAGFWMVAGPSLRDIIPGFGTNMPRAGSAIPSSDDPRRTDGDTQDVPSGGASPRRVAEGGPDVAEDGPAAAIRSREQVEFASLPARNGQDHASRTPIPATASTAELLAAIGQGPQTPSAAASTAMARAVEMPPAMIGPLSLRHAAAKGNASAQLEVATRFAEGKGIPQDFAQAANWYQRAATQGLALAQYRLGALYERGLGLTADPARARIWYGRAAEQGNVRAMHNLAVLSAGRPGMSPDYPSAVQWFTEAASRGLADSQYNLGILYESGLGVPANNIEAYKWYSLAARSGDKDAAKRRDIVRAKLDSGSVRSADALVIQWRARAVEGAANDARAAGAGWQTSASEDE